jgi:hypothetical protein
MFNEYRNSRSIAEDLKRLIDQDLTTGEEGTELRHSAHRAVAAFERCEWYPEAFQEALVVATPGFFYLENDHLEYANDPKGELSVASAVKRVLSEYIHCTDCRPTAEL